MALPSIGRYSHSYVPTDLFARKVHGRGGGGIKESGIGIKETVRTRKMGNRGLEGTQKNAYICSYEYR